MTDLDQESLFSLELIVDRLHLHHSVECRIPAVAFRLLDFPTLLIYHVEPELAARLRSKLLADHYSSVPAQLNELKDPKTGTFLMGRGKSCLFRVSPNTVVSSFSSAPLYVMVVDMFPETPKLVGSCGVPLTACARDLYNDIVTDGISVPAVQSKKKELDLCNLMGAKLGTILLGYRLLSLGSALLSHIPTQNIIRIKPEEEVDQHFYPTNDKVRQSITETSIAAKQSTNVESSDNVEVDKIVEKTFTDSQTQIELPGFGSVGTQTSRLRSHTNKPRTPLANKTDDIITNTVCPPPLFYNSTVCKKTVSRHKEEWSYVWQMANDGSNWSDDGTIRVEDKYVDAHKEVTDNKNLSNSFVKDKPSPHVQSKNVLRSDPATKTPYQTGNMTEFPILGALMAEILRFQGMNFVPNLSGVDADREVQYQIQKMKKVVTLQKGHPEKEVQSERFAYKCANVTPADKERRVSKQRSYGTVMHQKPLFAGMTNTQRLRLARVNPKLLQELEAKEMQRRNELRASCMSHVRKQNVPSDSHQNADEIDSVKQIDISRSTECVDESRESTARYKCPVPTPRMSKMFLADKDFADVDTSYFATKTYSVGHNRNEPELLQQSSSEENTEFTFAPIKGGSENDHGTWHGLSAPTSATVDSKSAAMQAATHLKLNTSGSDDSDAAQTPSLSAKVYRDASAAGAQLEATDAGGMLSLEDLGLRKIVDHYSGSSDDDDDDDGTEGSYDDKELKGGDTECSSAEGERKSGHQLSEVSEKCTESDLLQKVVNQNSDVSEDEEHDLEYEYDFEDTPVHSLKTVSPVNSSTSSILDSTVHRHMTGNQVAGTDRKMSGHSWLIERMGEQCND